MPAPKRIIVAISGASGALYAKRLVETLTTSNIDVLLIVSTIGRRLLHDELGIESGGPLDLAALAGSPEAAAKITLLPYKDVGACAASGSFKTDGMVLVPCSNNKLAELAHGLGDNLISRAAQVVLKERRRLILVHRETPLGLIELRNMTALAEAGAVICPANPGFYNLPQSIDDLVNMLVGRILDLLDIDHQLHQRWTGKAPPQPPAAANGHPDPALLPPPAIVPQPASSPPPAPAIALPLPPLTLGDSCRLDLAGFSAPRSDPEPAPAPAPAMPASASRAAPAPEILQRLPLKAAAAEIARQKAEKPGPADYKIYIKPQVDELIPKAKALPNCYLWMIGPSAPAATPPQWAALCDAFKAAHLAALAATETADPALPDAARRDALQCLASAQSALRAAVFAITDVADDDQDALHQFLRVATRAESLYCRHMKADEPFPPDQLPALLSQLEQWHAAHRNRRARQRTRDQHWKRLAYHAAQILTDPDAPRPDDWQRIAQESQALVDDHVPFNAPEFAQHLLPILDAAPDSAAQHPLLAQILDALAPQEDSTLRASASAAPAAASPDILAVRQLLQGKSVVFIGGEVKPYAREKLRAAFQLQNLDWLPSREHQSTAPFEAPIARPDTALVLLAIRWSSHSFGDAKMYCDRHHKPLVRLPRGYNPNQVAREILEQCSGLLASAVAE